MKTVLIACLTVTALLMASPHAEAQIRFDRIRRQIGDQINREVERGIRDMVQPSTPRIQNPRNPGRGVQDPPQAQSPASNSFNPNESGSQNQGTPFQSGNFFQPPQQWVQPRPQPQPYPVVNPQPTPQPYRVIETRPQSRVVNSPPQREVVSVSNQDFKIRCPRSMTQSVPYRLIGGGSEYPFTIQPGQAQTIAETRVYRIRFRPGTGGEITYRLRGGKTYEFGFDANGQLQLFEDDLAEAEPPKKSTAGMNRG